MNKIITAYILIILIACNQKSKPPVTKTLDFGAFTIETPLSWNKFKEKGIDSYVGGIALDDKDTLTFDLGWYSNRLYEYDPIIYDSIMMPDIDTTMINLKEIIFVKSRAKVDPDRYRKNNVLWDTIDGRKAKIVYPRTSGIGIVGVYIDSLWVSGVGIDAFNLYGENFKPENEKKVLQALRTLKFHKK